MEMKSTNHAAPTLISANENNSFENVFFSAEEHTIRQFGMSSSRTKRKMRVTNDKHLQYATNDFTYCHKNIIFLSLLCMCRF